MTSRAFDVAGSAADRFSDAGFYHDTVTVRTRNRVISSPRYLSVAWRCLRLSLAGEDGVDPCQTIATFVVVTVVSRSRQLLYQATRCVHVWWSASVSNVALD